MQATAPAIPIRRPAPLRSSVVAVAAVGCALLLSRLALSLSISTPFHFFYGAVAVSAWYSGVRGGAPAIILSILVSDYFLIAPIDEIAFDPGTIFRITTFVVISGLVTALSEERLHDRDMAMHARERAAYLARVSQILARSLDYRTTLRQAADLAVPVLADWCVIDVLDDDGRLAMLAVAHADPERVRWAYRLREQYPVDPDAPAGAPKVIRTGEAELYAEISDQLLAAAARSPEELRMLQAVGYRSLMIVPLQVGGTTIGAVSFVIAESARRYSAEDLTFAQEVAERMAAAIDNARLYSQAHAARAQAEEAVLARDNFLSVAAHELKTPLTSLQLQVQLIERRALRDGTLVGRDKRMVEVISSQVRRLNRMISSLLDISRLEHGQLDVYLAPLDLDALARRVVDETQQISDAHTICYQSAAAESIVAGDELRLEQVLQNLLHNAIKYSPRGGQITVMLETEAGTARVAVTDQGIGVPEDEQARLFTQFYRAANASPENISGMGIGLYVVREILRLHNGSVSVASVEGEGSTFSIELPLLATRPPGRALVAARRGEQPAAP